jgi:PAS domain S-box-containing protein
MVKEMDLDKNGITKSRLRAVAEEKLSKLQDTPHELKEKTPEDIIHELQVHQIELEMQNETLREAQQALQEAHDRYIDLYDYAPVGYFTVDKKGTIHEANLTATSLLGVDRVSLVGKPLSHFVFEDDSDTCYLKLRQVFLIQEKMTCELRFVKEKGDQFYAQLEGITVQDLDGKVTRARIIFTDISKRKRIEETLERQHNLTQMYLDIAGVMLAALNTEGQITMINRKGCEIIGYRDDEIIGRNWFDVCLPGALREEVKNVFNKLMAGDITPVEYYENPVLTRDGEQLIIAFHNTVLYDSSHSIVGILFSGEDITERKLAEQEKQKLIADLQKALSEVKKLSGFLPICASCKKIRDDTGYWNEVERYIGEHSEAKFSHGICPDCMRKLYPEEADEILGPLEKDEKK